MVRIRLRRTGAKKQPSYRVVVADSRAPRDGRFIEIIGHYNPRTDPVTVNIEEDRALHWLSVGAQPTDTVRALLKNLGTLDRFARLKQGEDLEKLLAEAQVSYEQKGDVSDQPRAEKKETAETTKVASSAVSPEKEVEESTEEVTTEPAATPEEA